MGRRDADDEGREDSSPWVPELQIAIVSRIFTASSVAHRGLASSEGWNLWSSDILRWRSFSWSGAHTVDTPQVVKPRV
jgi:hypothetical protein